jgi:hypothetical protein
VSPLPSPSCDPTLARQWREMLAQAEEYFKEMNGNPLAAILENLK